MLEVITGPMFCGKTEELCRRLRRCEIAGRHVAVFKPEIDSRSEGKLLSHLGTSYKAIEVKGLEWARDVTALIDNNVTVLGFDEAQFFDREFYILCLDLVNYHGYRVIVAGLDMTYLGKPFGGMPKLMAVANKVDKLTAVCILCGSEEGYISDRISNSSEEIEIGAKDKYRALCRTCFVKERSP